MTQPCATSTPVSRKKAKSEPTMKNMIINILKLWTGPLPIQELFPADRRVNPLLHWIIHPVKRHIAKYYLLILQNFFGLKVIAVTGSSGKTTTVNMLYHVLSQTRHTVKTADSITTTYNLPTTILKCTPQTKYLILEMGVEYPGDMDFYCWLAKPDISTVLNTTSVHSTYLGTLNQIKNEKYKLQKYSRIFIPPEKYPKVISAKITPVLKTQIKINYNRQPTTYSLRLLGQQFSLNTSAVVKICELLNISPQYVKSGLESVTPPAHRMNVIRFKNGNILLDDTYNANPLSVSKSLHTLYQLTAKSSKLKAVFVFAQMNELGSYEKSAHEKIGLEINKLGIRNFYCLGSATKHSIKAAGFGKYFEDIEKLTKEIKSLVLSTSHLVLLVKGSRSWHLENLVNQLQSN